MNWRSFFSGALGGFLVVASLTFPIIKAQTPWGAYPIGIIFMVTAASCPADTHELTAFNGAMPYGTIAANGDVGGTGGANTITPTVATLTAAAQTFTGSSATTSSNGAGTPAGTVTAPTVSWPAGVPTFAGSALATHTHTVTAAGTNGATTTSGNTAATNIAAGTGSLTAAKATAPNLTVPAETFTGSQVTSGATSGGTPAGTVAWPAGVPTNSTPTFSGSALAGHTHTLTATGSNGTSSVTGTLNSFDNRPAFVKVIFCQKS